MNDTDDLMRQINGITQLAQSNQAEFLCFNAGDDSAVYAINVFKVIEVVMLTEYAIQPMTGCHPYTVGVISHRVGVVPVVDISQWLNDGNVPKSLQNNKLIICNFNKTIVAFLASRDANIERRNWKDIHESDFLKSGKKIVAYAKKMGADNQTEILIYLLDVEALLSELYSHHVKESQLAIDPNLRITNNKQILLADDSGTARNHMRKGLESVGITNFHMFNNGQALLDFLAQTNPINIGLIITDLEMPETSGFIVVKAVKENPLTKHIPVLVQSSMSGDNNVREAKKLGADEFIAKTNLPEFVAKIDKYVLRNP